MAYFSNGSEGSVFENECSHCKYGNEPCPIFLVQMEYNYDACNNKVASAILNRLVRQGAPEEHWKYKGCAMKELIDEMEVKSGKEANSKTSDS